MSHSSLFFISLFFIACEGRNYDISNRPGNQEGQASEFETINAVPLPDGYERVILARESFGEWLRAISLKKDNRVYL